MSFMGTEGTHWELKSPNYFWPPLAFGIFVEADNLNRRVLGQQGQRGFQHAPLLGFVVRLAQGCAPIELGDGGSGWVGGTCPARVPTGERGGDALHFQSAGNQSNGLGADGSGRHQQGSVYFLGFDDPYNFRNQFINHARNIRLIPAKTNHR